MRFIIDKPKTYKGLSYVLKSSHLKDAIEDAGLDINIHLVFWTPQSLGSILTADYWLPNENVDYDRFYIRAGAIKSEDRKKAESLMKEYVIPDLIKRIQKIKSYSIHSTQLNDSWFFEATYEAGILRINGKEIPTKPSNNRPG